MADNHLAVEAAGPRSPVADHVAYMPCSFSMYDGAAQAALNVCAEVSLTHLYVSLS